jgi:hypothetical protein
LFCGIKKKGKNISLFSLFLSPFARFHGSLVGILSTFNREILMPKGRKFDLERVLGDFYERDIFYDIERTQAERIIYKFNGARNLTRALRQIGYPIHFSTVYRWRELRETGGTDGVIPLKHWPAIRAAAKLVGIFLTPSDWELELRPFTKPPENIRRGERKKIKKRIRKPKTEKKNELSTK